MASTNILIHKSVTTGAAQVNGESIRVGGNPVTVQILSPGSTSLGRVEVSNDRYNWALAHSVTAGTSLTAIGDAVHAINERAEWIRPCGIADTAAPQALEFMFSVFKES
jgi:hypothetical protein